jgi:hypothetical protein
MEKFKELMGNKKVVFGVFALIVVIGVLSNA